MNIISWFFIGFGSAVVASVPLVGWAKDKGRAVYANSRIRGKSGKLFKDEEIQKLLDSSMLPKIQKSRYWHLLQFSETREDYEKKLESLFDEELSTLVRLSSPKIQDFLETYYRLQSEFDDLKLILYCIHNNRDRTELRRLLKTEKYTHLLEKSHINDAMNDIDIDSLNFATYSQYGIVGLEYAIDDHYFKKLRRTADDKTLMRLYKIVRTNYLLNQILRLKKLSYKENQIIDLLRLKMKKEIEYVKKDINIMIKEFSEKDKTLRKMLLSGERRSQILDYYFTHRLVQFTSQEKLREPFSMIGSFHLLERIRNEIKMSKNIWLIQ